MIVFDACVVIAHLERHDALHARGVQLMHAAAPFRRRIASLTLAEVLIGFEKIAMTDQALRDITHALHIIEVLPEQGWAKRLAAARVSSGLRLPAAVVLAEARHLNAQIATFDSALADVARRENRLFEP